MICLPWYIVIPLLIAGALGIVFVIFMSKFKIF